MSEATESGCITDQAVYPILYLDAMVDMVRTDPAVGLRWVICG